MPALNNDMELTTVDVAGLKISPYTKKELLDHISGRLKARQQSIVMTPYSEFLYHALRDHKLMALFNQATFSVADGMGILWAQKFLSLPIHSRSKLLRGLQSIWQGKWTLWAILLRPSLFYKVIPEKIVGAQLIWDLAALADRQSLSVYLLGGFGYTPDIVAEVMRQRFPSLSIVGSRNWSPGDESKILPDLERAKPDMLFLAFGPVRQEQWMMEYVPKLPVKLAIGLGGTFDYIAGYKLSPPGIIRSVGLEWMFRLFTQPKRILRIYRATFGLAYQVWKYKVNHYD